MAAKQSVRLLLGASLATLLCWAPVAGSSSDDGCKDQMKKEEAIPGELLIRFEDNISAVEIDRVNARLGVEVINRMAGGKLVHIRVPSGQSLETLADVYRSTPGVRYVEVNVRYRIDEPKTDGEVDSPKIQN